MAGTGLQAGLQGNRTAREALDPAGLRVSTGLRLGTGAVARVQAGALVLGIGLPE